MNQLSMKWLVPAMMTFGQVAHVTASNMQEEQKHDKRPNILFFLADDATYYHFHANGCPWVETPNFDRVAKDGIVFDQCYTPNAKSAPSRAAILTGRYSWQLRQAGNHVTNFPTDIKVFTDVLREQGYDVAYTGKGWAPGNPGVIDGKPRELTGHYYHKHTLKAPTTGISNVDYAANFGDFLVDQSKKDTPWFFWFGSHEPHRKYQYHSGVEEGKMNPADIDHVPAYWPDNEIVRNDMLDYGYEIEYFDAQIGKALKMLEKTGKLHNTIIVITSDNGMPFPRSKANNYNYSNHMPLAVMWADGIKHPGRRIQDYVSFVDLAPTFLDMAEVPHSSEALPFSGQSLRHYLQDNVKSTEKNARRIIYFGRERDDYGRPKNQGYPIRAIMRDGMLYIHNLKPSLYPAGNPLSGYLDIDGSPTKTLILQMARGGSNMFYWNLSCALRPEEEMYDLTRDIDCMNNLANVPSLAKTKAELKALLLKKCEETNDPRLGDDPDIFSRYKFNNKENWNFYERIKNGELKEPWKQTKWVNPTDYSTYPDNDL